MWIDLAKYTTIIFTFLLIVFGGFFGYQYYKEWNKLQSVSSFATCATAGYPITISSPLRCFTPNGRSYTKKVSESTKTKSNRKCDDSCKDGVCPDIKCP